MSVMNKQRHGTPLHSANSENPPSAGQVPFSCGQQCHRLFMYILTEMRLCIGRPDGYRKLSSSYQKGSRSDPTLTSVQLTQLCSPVWAPGSKNVLIDIDHSERLLELP